MGTLKQKDKIFKENSIADKERLWKTIGKNSAGIKIIKKKTGNTAGVPKYSIKKNTVYGILNNNGKLKGYVIYKKHTIYKELHLDHDHGYSKSHIHIYKDNGKRITKKVKITTRNKKYKRRKNEK